MHMSAYLVAAAMLASWPAQGQAQAPADRVALWQGLQHGMSPDEAGAALQAVPGIAEAKLTPRRGKQPKVNLRYSEQGVRVGDLKATVKLTFSEDRLTEVTLVADACASTTVAQMKLIMPVLKEKYGQSGRETVVDEKGVPFATQFAFWNDVTRVRLSFREYNLAAAASMPAPVGGTVGALAELGAAITAESARKACPADGGGRAETTINYSAQSIFQAEQAAMRAKTEEARRKAADGL